MLRPLNRIFSGFIIFIMLLAPVASIHVVSASALGTSFTVNSTADWPDVDVGNPTCLATNGGCTLRAAIQQANFTAGADTIILPAGVFTLDRPGLDDAAVLGDLDLTDSLTIQGAGSGLTIVDGNGIVTGDRVFQIFSSAKQTTLTGLTVRNGKRVSTFDQGGGIYWDGGGVSQLNLKNVVIENSTAYYGGGLYLNYSTLGDRVDLDHLNLHGNSATASAGGLGVNLGDFAIFNLHDSQVYGNSAYEAGGVYLQGTTTFDIQSASIINTLIYTNTASLSAGFENHGGNVAVPVILKGSQLYQNHASFYGGAIGNYGALNIMTTTLDSNTAVTRGGGIYDYEGGQLDIEQSTLSRNTSTTGGGVYSEFFIHNNSGIVLTNSTLSGNSASKDGGGIYAEGGQIKLYNVTIATNHVTVPVGVTYSGVGGGMYILTRVVFSAQNALIADNTHAYGAYLPVADDCFGTINSLGYNLVENTFACALIGTLNSNLTGVDPKLGPLQTSIGSTQTQEPKHGSPAIDAGQTPNCTDANGVVIMIDQRGVKRPLGGRCDIGAVEHLPFDIFLPETQK